MNELITAIPTGLTAFTATNLDDIVILTLWFSQVNAAFRRRQIILGQYLGVGALVAASVPSFFGSAILPRPWIGLLGIVPIVLGISRWLNQEQNNAATEVKPEQTETTLNSFLSPQTYGVAAVTIANGGDNIGIYVPLFASSSGESLVVILSVFFVLVGVWCYAAYQLTRLGAIAEALTRYGNYLVPFVLVGLGVMILLDSRTLENHGLAAIALVTSCLWLLVLSRNWERSPVVVSEVEKH